MAAKNIKKWLSEREQEALDKGQTPLEFLIDTYRDEALALEIRIDAAAKAAPYVGKKAPQAIEHSGPDGSAIKTEDVGAAREKLSGILSTFAPVDGAGDGSKSTH